MLRDIEGNTLLEGDTVYFSRANNLFKGTVISSHISKTRKNIAVRDKNKKIHNVSATNVVRRIN